MKSIKDISTWFFSWAGLRNSLIITVVCILCVVGFALWKWDYNATISRGGFVKACSRSSVADSVDLRLQDCLIYTSTDGAIGVVTFSALTSDWGVDYFTWHIPSNSEDRCLAEIPPMRGHVKDHTWYTRGCGSRLYGRDVGSKKTITSGPLRFYWFGGTSLLCPPEVTRIAIHPFSTNMSVSELRQTIEKNGCAPHLTGRESK